MPWTPMDVRECGTSICINGWRWAANSALPVGEGLPSFLTSTRAYLCCVLWAEVRWLLVVSKPASSKHEIIQPWLAQQWTQALLRVRFRLPQVQHCPNTATPLLVYSWLTSGCVRAQASLCLQINSETCLKIQSRNPNQSYSPLLPFYFFLFSFFFAFSPTFWVWLLSRRAPEWFISKKHCLQFH